MGSEAVSRVGSPIAPLPTLALHCSSHPSHPDQWGMSSGALLRGAGAFRTPRAGPGPRRPGGGGAQPTPRLMQALAPTPCASPPPALKRWALSTPWAKSGQGLGSGASAQGAWGHQS